MTDCADVLTGLAMMIIEKMMVGKYTWPSSGREAVVLRKPKEIVKILHMDVQYVVKVDVIQTIYLVVNMYVLLVLR
jgi:hypothetical protein